MKKILLGTAIIAAASMSSAANAALASNANLDFNDFVLGGYYGTAVVGGSYFAMDTDGSGTFITKERTGITKATGLAVNTAQAAGTIDNSWVFFGPSGSHSTLSATTILSQTASSADLDFSGWTVDWNNTEINMGSGASGGVGTVVCAVNCSLGDTFSLDYFATVPNDGTTNFGNVSYMVHLEGTIGEVSAVPVPAAAWLFGTGLLGLVGVARRKAA